MENLETLRRAKYYIDSLANGLNHLDNKPVPETDIVNNVRVSRCFFYVSDVLRKVIENGGVKDKEHKQTFYISDEALDGFDYSDKPIYILRRWRSG